MSRQPNILLIMTDQQRADLRASEGFGLDTMPFLDSFTSQGMQFRRAYTTAPACVPARTSLLTGRYPSAHGVRQNSAVRQVVRGEDLIDVLRQAGYELHFAGKTHMYRGKEDFDIFSGPYMHERGPDLTEEHQRFSEWLRSIDHGPSHEPTPFPVESQFPYRIVSDAISAWQQRDPSRPTFSWVSFPEPHNPYQVPEPYFSMFPEIPDRACGPEAAIAKGGSWRWLRELIEEKRPGYDEQWRRYRASYCGMLRLLDDQIKRLIDAVYDDNTIVVFLADHGDYVGDYGLQRKGAGVPEVLMRVPCAAVGPGIEARVNDTDFISLADLLPTLCEVVGQPIPHGVQGRSLWPMWTGADYPAAEFGSGYAEHGFGGVPYDADARPELHFSYDGTTFDCLNSVTQSGHTRMLRRGQWKLVYNNLGQGELYDLATDPMELHNRWDDPALRDVRSELTECLLRWATRLLDDLPRANYEPRRAPHNWYAAVERT